MGKKNLPVVIVFLISVLAILDLANFGIPPTHDGEYHVMRFQQFYKVLSEGNLYPRWAPDFNNGFGIPLFNYVYPLPNYIAALSHVIGFSFIDSFKLNMALATIVGAIFMYLWSKKYWGEAGGAVSSVFYTFSPYHFLDIYVRGSAGEVWSLGLAPALLWAYHSYYESNRKMFLVLSSIFLALLILSHNILALVFFGFFILYASYLILNLKEKKALILNTFIICLTGLGLSSPFWLPAIFETHFVQGLQVAAPLDHFPKLYQLIYSSWGYGFSGIDRAGQMSFQIGIANLLGLFSSIVILFISIQRRIMTFFISTFLITVFFITPFSAWFWENIPFINYVQYPWRFLSLVILVASFLAGGIVQNSLFKKRNKLKFIAAAALIIISIGFSIRYAKAPFYHKRTDQHYLTRPNFTDGTNSPGDGFNTVWLNKIPSKAKEKVEIIEGSGKIKIEKIGNQNYVFETYSNNNLKLRINTAYFPGWVAYIDNNEKKEVSNKSGIMALSVPKGIHKIRIELRTTIARTISYIIFTFSIVLLALLPGRAIGIIKK